MDEQRVQGNRSRPRRAQRGLPGEKWKKWKTTFCSRPAPPLRQSASAAPARLIDRSSALFTFSSGTSNFLFCFPLHCHDFVTFVTPNHRPSVWELLVFTCIITTRLLSVSPRVYSIFVLHCCRVASISCSPQKVWTDLDTTSRHRSDLISRVADQKYLSHTLSIYIHRTYWLIRSRAV